MSLHPAMTRSIDQLRSRAGELLDRARSETTEQVAHISGRGAGWVDEAGQALAGYAENLAEAAGARATRVAGGVAGAVDRWTTNLGDRMVRLGAGLTGPRPERD